MGVTGEKGGMKGIMNPGAIAVFAAQEEEAACTPSFFNGFFCPPVPTTDILDECLFPSDDRPLAEALASGDPPPGIEPIDINVLLPCYFSTSPQCCDAIDTIFGPFDSSSLMNCLCQPGRARVLFNISESQGFDLKGVFEGCDAQPVFDTLWTPFGCEAAGVLLPENFTNPFDSIGPEEMQEIIDAIDQSLN